MELSYDIWLVLISLLAGSLVTFITFSFVSHLYRSSVSNKRFLLPMYSITLGSAIWGLHFLNWLAFQSKGSLQTSTPLMASSWLIAMPIGFAVCYAASKKTIPLQLLLLSSATAGLCAYVMYYLLATSIYSAANIAIDPVSLLISLVMSVVASVLGILSMYWMKEYTGKNSFLIKVILSIVTAATIIGLHITFNGSLILQSDTGASADYIFSNKKMLAFIIALSIACLFLLIFTVALFYEKFSTNTFKFGMLSRQKNSVTQDTKDALTHLPNRRAFQHQLDIAAKHCSRTGDTIAIAYIDLDHFKPINDNYGHHVGDAVLATAAQRLQAAVRGCDTVARLGGDEFVALLEEIQSDEDITAIAERIVSSIKEPFLVNYQQIEISCSVGIAIYPRDGDIAKLMVCADAAMYKAKENGKNQFRFYDAEIESASDQMIALHSDLQVALQQNQFNLVFLPKFDCETHLPVGAEALLRWHHPIKGVLAPKDFIAEATRFGFISDINEWVMEEVCRTIQRAKKQGIDLKISINLPRQQFRNANLVHEVIEVLRVHEVPAKNITFEIKDTASIKNEKQFKLLLKQFKLAKIKIALDDFGLHPFTLAYLQELSIDELKLDRMFISKMTKNQASRALVDAVIKLAHALGFNVVAEGIETEEQRNMLADLGCNHMQGFLLSKPVPEKELLALFKQLCIHFESTGELFSEHQAEAA